MLSRILWLENGCTLSKLCTYRGPQKKMLCCVVGFKADCLTRDQALGGMPSVGVFLRDPSPYLRDFQRKPRKTPNG